MGFVASAEVGTNAPSQRSGETLDSERSETLQSQTYDLGGCCLPCPSVVIGIDPCDKLVQ